jgi:VanZ family protein
LTIINGLACARIFAVGSLGFTVLCGPNGRSPERARQGVSLKKLAQILALVLLVVGLFLSVGPGRLRPYTGIPHDIEHFVAFAIFGLPFGFGFPHRWLLLSLAAIAAAAAIEALQLVVPGRHAYLIDFVINAAGASIGVWLGAVAAWLWARGRRI